MFDMDFNGKYRIKYARTGFKQSGEQYAVVAMTEDENQPAGLEHPSKSKSTIKVWMPKLPEGVTDGCVIRVVSFTGFSWRHIPGQAFGKTVYNDEVVLKNAVIELAEAEG